ncbi:MAG: hypothetical protein HKN32_01485, partial [Flavobacteriales bacterium]|nr:hypothetical protein [Flavobacteriales bacterium]
MQLIEVQSSSHIKAFHHLPFEIYADDPVWVPHLQQDVEKVFDPSKNKLFRTGMAKRWLAVHNGKVCGRIAAFVNEKYSKGMEQPTGGLGFFESINDKVVAFALLDEAIAWLKSNGMDAVDGPINFGEKNMFWGLQIENFVDPPSYGMNYNPEYYKGFFAEYGFEVYYNQFCYKRRLDIPVHEDFEEKSKRMMQDPKFAIRNIRGRSLERVAEDFLTVYNNAWGGHHGFKKMKLREAQKIMKALKPVIDRDIVIFAFYDEKPIAFYVNIPELNEIFCYVNGNLNWLGKLKFLYHKWRRTPKTMVGIVFGIDRAFHGRGVESTIVKYTEKNVVPMKRYTDTVMVWIGDFNPKMITIVEKLGPEKYRTLATFLYLFDRTK